MSLIPRVLVWSLPEPKKWSPLFLGNSRNAKIAGGRNLVGQRGRISHFPSGGGAEGDRTPDLYNAIVALSQLSYGPASPIFTRPGRRALPRL